MYSVNHQCCSGRNRPETPRRPGFFGQKTGKSRQKFQKKMEILSGFASDLARISGDPQRPPAQGLGGGLLTISAIAGSHGTLFLNSKTHLYLSIISQSFFYRCVECDKKFSVKRPPRLCDYTGLSFCPDCHWNAMAQTPARIIHNWDFSPRPVSQATKQYLFLMQRKPVIDISQANHKVNN